MTAMTTEASARKLLHQLVDSLTDKDAERLLDWINLQNEPDDLTPEEEERVAIGKAEIARGDYVTREAFRKELGLEL
jgi:hypothetical protein